MVQSRQYLLMFYIKLRCLHSIISPESEKQRRVVRAVVLKSGLPNFSTSPPNFHDGGLKTQN